MPKKKRILEVELEMHLDIAVKKQAEAASANEFPKVLFPEVHALLDIAQKAPLRTKGTVVIRFAYGEVEHS